MVVCQSSWPLSTLSSFFSIPAEKVTSTMFGNCSIISSLMVRPSSVGFRRLASRST